MKAGIDYSQGKATLGFLGYPSHEASNLDPVLRLRHNPEGAPTGTEYLALYPYNTTVKALIKRIGFQSGSYLGYLPNSSEVKDLLQSFSVRYAKVIVSEEIVTITVEQRTIKLDLAAQSDQIKHLLLMEPLFSKAPYVVKGDCLVIALNEKWIYLIDIEGEQILSHILMGNTLDS